MERFKATTVVAVKKDGKLVIGCDGQVTLGESIFKNSTMKLRRLYNDEVVVGFAGIASDAFIILDSLEEKLELSQGDLKKAAISVTKEWRQDRNSNPIEAMAIVGNSKDLLIISGDGDILIPDGNIASIGSGSVYASASSLALIRNTDLSAREIVLESLKIASEMCIYTNSNISLLDLDCD